MTNLVREAKDENRVVAGWLIHYHKRKEYYDQCREEVLYSTPQPPEVVTCPINQNSDTTGKKALALATFDENTGKWLALVEDIEEILPWKMQIVLKLRRETMHRPYKSRDRGRPAWIPYVQVRYAEEVAKRTGKAPEDVWIERPRTFIEWWNRIVEYAARLAAKKGLL